MDSWSKWRQVKTTKVKKTVTNSIMSVSVSETSYLNCMLIN